MMRWLRVAALACALPALADDALIAPVAAPLAAPVAAPKAAIPLARPLWEVGAGIAAVRFPDYLGSDQSRAYLLPLPYIVYRGSWLRADRDGARALLLQAERVKIDVSVAATVPAHSNDNVARRGMPDLQPTVEVGPNVNIELLRSADGNAQLDLRLPLRAAIALQRQPRSIGTTFSPNLNLDLQRVAGGWHLGLLGGPLYADRRYHEHFYGVDAAYATPERPAYRAPGGYAGWRAVASTSRRIGKTWVGAFVRYDNLNGAAFAASPLVRRHDALTFGVGVSWVLATSSRLVLTDD